MQIPCWRLGKNEEPFMCSSIIFVFPVIWQEVSERGIGAGKELLCPARDKNRKLENSQWGIACKK